MIHGVTIQLGVTVETDVNDFGETVKTVGYTDVDDVLIGQPSADELVSSVELTGNRTVYVLGIPKGDMHEWKDTTVILPEPFGGTYRTVGEPTVGIEANIPLRWNKKVRVERIE